MSNHLQNESSPYLLQHAENPVNWFPWGDAAFSKAAKEDKPIFLSIGYSTCHWCHVMAGESFMDTKIAELLNKNYVAIKVDKEERPDIDSVYMSVCMAFTGSGGWPTTIFMTPDKKPFFAGTYFPKNSTGGMIGLLELLPLVSEKWQNDRETLLESANKIVLALNTEHVPNKTQAQDLIENAFSVFQKTYDAKYGGFGNAPKFPSPHNLLFLLQYAKKNNSETAKSMVEKTLNTMYRGGIFDHIGYGFCRYSTDRMFLVPHFEKMLYDNALLILAYCKAYETTNTALYKQVAEKTADFVLRELKSKSGGFFSAKDADSDGVEGKYYVFTPDEIKELLGTSIGTEFIDYFGITSHGNFNGKSIPNLLQTARLSDNFDTYLPQIRDYREKRSSLHTDDKIITAWNCYMITALCNLYRITTNSAYLSEAVKAFDFIEKNLCEGNRIYVSIRNGKRGTYGFLDDYAGYSFALLALYDSTLDNSYLLRAKEIINKAIHDFFDLKNGGFYLNGIENEQLILRPKDNGDGAIPGGNSLITYCLVRLSFLLPNDEITNVLKKQLDYMTGKAAQYPSGYAMLLIALSDYTDPPETVTIVYANDDISDIPLHISSDTQVKALNTPTEKYKLLNEQSTFYVCEKHCCLPPICKDDFIQRHKPIYK